MKIIVDADACPREAMTACLELGKRYGAEVWTVASFNHVIVSDHHVTVGDAPQEADIKIVNLTEAGDLVVTQDWGLAAMVLGKGAIAVSPAGREYRNNSIDFLMEERELKAKWRRGGGRTKGPRKRTQEDNEKFRLRLEACLQRINPGSLS